MILDTDRELSAPRLRKYKELTCNAPGAAYTGVLRHRAGKVINNFTRFYKLKDLQAYAMRKEDLQWRSLVRVDINEAGSA